MSRLLLLIVPNSSKASIIRWTRVSLYLFTGFSPPYKWWELYISCSRLTFSVTVRQIASPGRHPWSLFPIYNSQSIGGRCCGLCGTYLRVRVGILSRLSQRAPWSLCLINAAVTHQKLDFSLSYIRGRFDHFRGALCLPCPVPSRSQGVDSDNRTEGNFWGQRWDEKPLFRVLLVYHD